MNKGISEATTKKMDRHLWYLSEELVGLSLFDDAVATYIKEEIVVMMKSNSEENKEAPNKRVRVTPDTLFTKPFALFASINTSLLFKWLNLPDFFLELPVTQWKSNCDYLTAQEVCKSLAVTNDHAGRAISLIQKFSGRLTKDEEQLQYLLQAISQQQKQISQPLKKNLM